jgi:cell division protein FtsL
MNTRAGHIPSFPALKARSTNLRVVLLAALVVAALMVYVGGKVQIMRIGYEIDDLGRQKQELERANRALQIEASSLSAPARIEEIAVQRLGMVMPPKENIVVVRRRADAGTTAPSGRGTADRIQR